MPTPTAAFLNIAAKYGDVDPDDIEAVQHWFTKVLPGLAPEKIEEVLEALLSGEGAEPDREIARSYPQGVPLPSLSSSPQALAPLTAAGWKELLSRLARRGPKG